MADTDPKQDIDIDDLQAAIDASAQATVSKKKEEPAAETPTQPEAPTDDGKVEIKTGQGGLADAPKKDEDQPAGLPASEEGEHMVARHGKTIKPLSEVDETEPAAEEEPEKTEEPAKEEVEEKPAEKTQVQSDDAGHNISVSVKSKPKPKIVNKPAAGPILDVAPAQTGSTKVEPKEEATEPTKEPTPEVEEEKNEEPTKKADKEEKPDDKPSEEVKDDESKKKDGDDSIKIQGLEGGKKKGDKEAEDDESPSIFDTKEYHLPIKTSRHHRRGQISSLWLAVILAIAVLGAGAWYVINNDVNVPFLNETDEPAAAEQSIDPNASEIAPENIEVAPDSSGTQQADTTQQEDPDEIRRSDIDAIAVHLEVYATNNSGTFPASSELLNVTTLAGATTNIFIAPNDVAISSGTSPSETNQYVYDITPSGCENATTNCTGYTLRAWQTSGDNYIVDSSN